MKEIYQSIADFEHAIQSGLVYIGTGCKDSKGREIGYIVGLNNNGIDFAAWVQNARKVNGEWKEFGVQQRSRSFPSQAFATSWAYATASVRRHNVRSRSI